MGQGFVETLQQRLVWSKNTSGFMRPIFRENFAQNQVLSFQGVRLDISETGYFSRCDFARRLVFSLLNNVPSSRKLSAIVRARMYFWTELEKSLPIWCGIARSSTPEKSHSSPAKSGFGDMCKISVKQLSSFWGILYSGAPPCNQARWFDTNFL